MASHILGISGKKRSGKDTLAARLIAEHGFTRIAFADPLKATLLDVDPWVRVEADELGLVYPAGTYWDLGATYRRLAWIVQEVGWEKAKEIREVRRLMQAHGVAIRTHVDSEVWVDAALGKALEVSGPVVITDVRFLNEATRVRWDNGAIVRIERPGLASTDAHVSETELDAFIADYVVRNDGTLDDLNAEADSIAAHLLAGG